MNVACSTNDSLSCTLIKLQNVLFMIDMNSHVYNEHENVKLHTDYFLMNTI